MRNLLWFLVIIAPAVLVVLLAPLIRHPAREESDTERAFNWIDSARQIVAGLWPR